MKELLTFSTRPKISVAVIVLAVMFCFGSCDSGSNPIPQSHPDNIGYINGVDIRASFTITEGQKVYLLERLEVALNEDWLQEHERFSQLRIIDVTGLDGDTYFIPVAGGTITGRAPAGGSLGANIWGALELM